MNLITQNIVRFIVLILLQILLINNLQFFGLCNPAIYVLCLIALPVSLPRWAELLIGFFTGLLIDIFSNTLGIHAAACTLLSFVRPLLIRRLVADNDRLMGSPSGASIGMLTYTKFITILVLIHHTVVFALEAFSFHNWWITLLQIIISSAVSIAIFLGINAVFGGSNSRGQ